MMHELVSSQCPDLVNGVFLWLLTKLPLIGMIAVLPKKRCFLNRSLVQA